MTLLARPATCSLCPHHTTTPDPTITFAKPFSVTSQSQYTTQILHFLQGPEDPLDAPIGRRALRILTLQTPIPNVIDEPVLQDAGVCSCCLPDYELLAPASEVR